MEDLDFADELYGTVQSVVFRNDENGYSVLRVTDAEDLSVKTVVGCVPYLFPGMSFNAQGRIETHKEFGEQFKIEKIETINPESPESLYAFLSSGAIKGVGNATATLIIGKFAGDTSYILENDCLRLSEIKGISEKKARAIGKSWKEQSAMRRLLEYMCNSGIRPSVAVRLYKLYSDKALNLIKENPYIICNPEIGGNFSEADHLAVDNGFETDSPFRIQAGIIYELKYNLNNGHCFIPLISFALLPQSLRNAQRNLSGTI